jgi:hypothetical protein
VCEREASRTGRTVEQCVSEFLLKHGHRPLPELTDSSAARHRSEWNGIWGQGVAATTTRQRMSVSMRTWCVGISALIPKSHYN